ncbi:hypothetical protein EP342_04685 [bacterium]|nr:MAG: hypothetical protein EP342_04685 [bacterium]
MMDKQFTDKEYELITQLLDGELSADQATEVEQLIADNPELQLELDRQSEISSAIKKDKEAFSPPKTAKDNVFLALGIPLAVSVPTATAITSEGGNMVSLVATFVASLMTFTLFYGLNNVEHDSAPLKKNIPIVSSYDMDNNNNVIILDDADKSKSEMPKVEKSASINATHNSISTNANSINDSKKNTIAENITENTNLSENIISKNTPERRELAKTWTVKLINSDDNSSIGARGNIFLQGNELTPNNTILTRDYLTVIRTIAGSNNLNSGSFDISFLTNYIVRDVRGIMSAGLSWYDVNSAVQLRNPVFFGGGIEYTPTFMELFANEYFDTFANGQLFIGKTPSYKLEAGLSTNLGGLVKFPIVIGYSKTYVRDYQFIQLESNENFFIGTEIIF